MSTVWAEDSKSAVAAAVAATTRARYITLKVVDQRQNQVRHTMRTTDKLQAIMDAYYSKVPGIHHGTGTFWFDAACLHRDRTPAQFEMEDGDVIDYFERQIGGGSDGAWMSA